MSVQRDLLLKKVTALSAVLIMLVSLVSLSSMGSQAANGQTNMSTCEKLPVRQVGANGARGTATAALAVDNDPATRWANQAVGSFIQLDFGESQVICDIDIAWYRGDVRSYNFVISTSEDGTNFKDIASAASTGKTTSLERYNIPDQSARYLRVTVHGNTQNDLGSINEMTIRGQAETQESPQQQNCTIPRITGVSAKGNDGHLPQNTLDNNANTRWSNFGFPSWIQYDLSTSQPICDVDIAWYRGNLRVNTFIISSSDDGKTFQTIFTGKSTGKTTDAERYDVTDVTAKYLRITVAANSENNNWASITRVGINAGFPPGPTPEPTDCKIPTITAVGATGNDGHLPKNTIDNNQNTRWSNAGLPSSIQYDLGSTSQPICDVDIAWYRGNLRVNTFIISSSDDGKNFVPIFIGKSTGKTTSPEKYDVQDTDTKYIRITVERNSETDWASITEVDINGGSQTPVPPQNEICGNGVDDDKDGQIDEGCTPVPTPKEICGNGVDDDKDGQIDEGCTPGEGGGGSGQTDTFGIQKIYPTKTNGEEWFMDMTDGQDPRSRPPSLTKNPDGSFKVESGQVRYGVFTTSGYQPDEVELDHGILAQRGYMQSPNDWKNVEMTGYVKVNSGQSGENFAWYARGGRHTGSGSPEGCEGVAYKPGLFYDGRVRFSKEQWHVSYAFTDQKRAMDSAEDKWVGFKGIMWNMEQNGNTVVKMEIWLDKNEDGKQDGPWEKVDENIDSGGWGSEGEECGGESDQIITWGGPIATFRWDGASDVDIKNFSVREIQPPSQ
jgi:hypothetical protein